MIRTLKVMILIFNLILIIKLVESTEKSDSGSVDFFGEQQENDVELNVLVCPDEPHKVPFFGFKCKTDEECVVPGEICCQQKSYKICRKGVTKQQNEELDVRIKGYQRAIRRVCPTRETLIEMLPIQNCTNDADCGLWRICCPDGNANYCRRAVPQLAFIFSSEIFRTFHNIMSYLQCTPPPPPLLDFFAKPCKNVFDCFPNLCCQEQGRKVCRPSRRSLFPLLTIPTEKFK